MKKILTVIFMTVLIAVAVGMFSKRRKATDEKEV